MAKSKPVKKKTIKEKPEAKKMTVKRTVPKKRMAAKKAAAKSTSTAKKAAAKSTSVPVETDYDDLFEKIADIEKKIMLLKK